jgi:hypothetical protein
MSYDLELSNGDIKVQSDGNLSIIQNERKLIQDMLKMLFTSTGEHKAHPWYGTPLLPRVIGSSYDTEILNTEIQSAVEYGLNNIKTLQQLQQRDNQFLTPRELLASVVGVDTEFDPLDKRKLVIKIDVITKSNNLISESFVINV